MSELALTRPAQLDLSNMAETAGLTALDTAGRFVNTVENILDSGAEIANTTVPAVTRFVGGFLLPEHFNRLLSTAVEYSTKVATYLGISGLKATAQTLTFGAPAWADAARQYLGVSAVAGELDHDDQSNELLARCIVQQTSDPLIQDSLLQYLDLRKELRRTNAASEPSAEKISELSQNIARMEIKLRDYQDFVDLKKILAGSEEFVAEQHKKITTLARETATRIIDSVENYYQDRCGSLAGEIQGQWSSASTEADRDKIKEDLTIKIAKRLQGVFERTLNEQETEVELNKIGGDLHSSFSTYGKATKAALFTILGVGYATGAFHHIAEAAGKVLKESLGSAYEWVSNQISSTWNWLTGKVNENVNGVVNKVISDNPVVKAVTDMTGGVSQAYDTATTEVQNRIEQASDAVSDFFSPGAPDYSHPYWSGTNKVFMGYNPDGTPLYGESCISGFPSTPRYNPGGSSDFSALKEIFERPAPMHELLKPGDAPKLDPQTAAELLKMLEGK